MSFDQLAEVEDEDWIRDASSAEILSMTHMVNTIDIDTGRPYAWVTITDPPEEIWDRIKNSLKIFRL